MIRPEVIKQIDSILAKIKREGHGSVFDLEDFHSDTGQMVFNLLADEGLISFQKGFKNPNSIFNISPKGETILLGGGYASYLDSIDRVRASEDERRQIELDKSKIDLELAKRMLREYPYTKWIARIGFLIALALAVNEIFKKAN